MHQEELSDHSICNGFVKQEQHHFPYHKQLWTQQPQSEDLNTLSVTHSERGIAGFVSKLYQCLQSNDGSPKYVRWCQHNGKDMFIIDCIPEFSRIVLPRLFKHCKFPSFVRQLNIYGFQRDTDARKSKDTRDKESCRWYHTHFRPNRRDLLYLIRRKPARYTRKKTLKAMMEDDPVTIIHVSADELDEEEEFIVNPNEHDILYAKEDDFYDNNDQSLSDPNELFTTTANSNEMMIVQSNNNNNNNGNDSRQSSLSVQQQIMPDMAEPIHYQNPFYDIMLEQQDPFLRLQHLRMELFELKSKYDKTEAFFKEQLNSASIQIDKQQQRIQELESTLSATKHPVKQDVQTGGYMDTVTTFLNGNYYPNLNQPHYIYSQPHSPWIYNQPSSNH